MTTLRNDEASVVVVQTILPDYRATFFRSLAEKLGSRLLLIAGDDDFAPGLEPLDGLPYKRVENRYLLGRRLLWQPGVLRPAVRAEVAVLLINPRIVTVWLVLVLRRVTGRRTVLWGHAWPRKGPRSRTDSLRHVLRWLADTVIVYTRTEARELHERSPDLDIVAAPNALYEVRELEEAEPHEGIARDFLFVGRLVPAKKPELLLEAFRLAIPELPADVRLVFVGDGQLRAGLESNAAQAGLAERTVFLGHVSEIRELRHLFANAIASVSPGYAGLSLIQSLGFGVPMLVARDEPHAPEIEAVSEGVNTIFFPSDSPTALASTLVQVARERESWRSRRAEIAAPIRTHYSIDSMVASFLSALRIDGDAASTRAIPTT